MQGKDWGMEGMRTRHLVSLTHARAPFNYACGGLSSYRSKAAMLLLRLHAALLCCLALRVHVLCAQQRQHVRHRHGRQLPSSSSLGYLAGPCQAPSASWQAPRLSSRAYCSPADPTRASGSKASRRGFQPTLSFRSDRYLAFKFRSGLPMRGPPSVCK